MVAMPAAPRARSRSRQAPLADRVDPLDPVDIADPAADPMPATTRDRILEVAQRRFIEQGYDGTSLREIADDLGFTKAALYYHFQTKDQILEALMAPAHVLINELFQRLEAATTVAEWGDALFWVIDQLHENFTVFQLMERNRPQIEHVSQAAFIGEHLEMHRRFEQIVRKLAADPVEEIRLITSIAAVTGFDDWGPSFLLEGDPAVIQAGLKGVVRDILRLKAPRRR
jgi:AcrR family transcriptional regulator